MFGILGEMCVCLCRHYWVCKHNKNIFGLQITCLKVPCQTIGFYRRTGPESTLCVMSKMYILYTSIGFRKIILAPANHSGGSRKYQGTQTTEEAVDVTPTWKHPVNLHHAE